MSDKENVEKENEQFSSSILYVATAVYIGVCAMVFGALYAKLPTFGEAFLELMKNYGTILAGIPVLVAVVVAKQQLYANRRQHVASVKRSFMKEIEAIKTARDFCQAVISADITDINNTQSPLNIVYDKSLTNDVLDKNVSACLSSVQSMIDKATSSLDALALDRQGYLTHSKIEAERALSLVERFEKRISQYWS